MKDELQARFTVWLEKVIYSAKIDYIRQRAKAPKEISLEDVKRQTEISLSNTNVVLTSLRKTGENTWEVRLFNNTPQTTKCICRAFGQDLTLVFGKYEVKTLCSEANILLEKGFMIK